MSGAPLFRAQGVVKRFGGVLAVDHVSFAITERTVFAIIGPNGAGKSTLFSLLCGIYRPDTGRVLLKGQDVTRLPAFRRVRRGLGLTFQTNRAYHALTVRQNLEIARRTDGAERSAAAEERFRYALDLFGLEAEAETLARELPHHRLQWLEIAMVLAGAPDIVLLDEPTAGLSPEETLQTARVLQHLNRSGLTIVVVEHDIAFVREVAQGVTVLHQGRIFAEGTVDEITAHEDVRRIYLGRA
jgi:branched-chain amino acid transport system ATP-binding protein